MHRVWTVCYHSFSATLFWLTRRCAELFSCVSHPSVHTQAHTGAHTDTHITYTLFIYHGSRLVPELVLTSLFASLTRFDVEKDAYLKRILCKDLLSKFVDKFACPYCSDTLQQLPSTALAAAVHERARLLSAGLCAETTGAAFMRVTFLTKLLPVYLGKRHMSTPVLHTLALSLATLLLPLVAQTCGTLLDLAHTFKPVLLPLLVKLGPSVADADAPDRAQAFVFAHALASEFVRHLTLAPQTAALNADAWRLVAHIDTFLSCLFACTLTEIARPILRVHKAAALPHACIAPPGVRPPVDWSSLLAEVMRAHVDLDKFFDRELCDHRSTHPAAPPPPHPPPTPPQPLPPCLFDILTALRKLPRFAEKLDEVHAFVRPLFRRPTETDPPEIRAMLRAVKHLCRVCSLP
eukprot:m.139986 g.139986  ORF g.139986 m.139986 type:complete len:407 (+) comp14942_c3_seq9:662-1882(+)